MSKAHDPAIIEAAARAIFDHERPESWDRMLEHEDEYTEQERTYYRTTAQVVLTIIVPLIEAAALERAAKVADAMETTPPSTSFIQGKVAAREIAAAIRALITKDSGGGD